MALQKRRTRMYEPWGYREENEYQSSAGKLGEDLDKFFASVEYNKKDKFIHFYNKDGEEKGKVDVTQFAASVIDDVTYDTTTKILTIKFANGDVIEINIAELIDEHEFGDGLIVEDGIVKVLIDESGDPYLTVGESGVKLSGIKSGFTSINSAITNINSAITNISGDVININSSITEINSAITNISGDVININSSITEINSAITIFESSGITDVILNGDSNLDLYSPSGYVSTVMLTDDYYTKQQISDKEKVVSAALNDLNDRKFDDVVYKPGVRLRTCGTVKYYSTNDDVKTELFTIDLDEMTDNIAYTKKLINKAIYETATSGESGSEVTYEAINFYTVTESGETLVSTIDARPFLSGFSEVWIPGEGENSAILKGSTSVATGDFAVAEGNITTATGKHSHAEGNFTVASGLSSHAEGFVTRAIGEGSHAEGGNTQAVGENSHAEGTGCLASGHSSHAEGTSTIAVNPNDHAEGGGTLAKGGDSHAEGIETSALTEASHAEGSGTTASGFAAHAEGILTNTEGAGTHAEGKYTKALGDYSHAEGSGTTAEGIYSHTSGMGTQTKNPGEFACGMWNESHSASTEMWHSGNTLFSIGFGDADDDRWNAFELRQNGDIYMQLEDEEVKLQDVILEDERVTAEGLNDLDKRVHKFETMFEENEDGYIILPAGQY